MKKATFEWDEEKNKENQSKHGVSFMTAQQAFLDPNRVIAEDITHSTEENRYYCMGRVGEGVLTVGRIRGTQHLITNCPVIPGLTRNPVILTNSGFPPPRE